MGFKIETRRITTDDQTTSRLHFSELSCDNMWSSNLIGDNPIKRYEWKHECFYEQLTEVKFACRVLLILKEDSSE